MPFVATRCRSRPRSRVFRAARVAAAASSCVLVVTGGCASWDDATFFPVDYQDRFTKLHNCRKGRHPSGDYVVVWINDIGKAALDDGTRPFPAGTVFVKSQYSDSACSEPTRYTASRKGEAGSAPDRDDWTWQEVSPSGAVGSCCAGGDPSVGTSCVGCHAGCASNDHVCTQP